MRQAASRLQISDVAGFSSLPSTMPDSAASSNRSHPSGRRLSKQPEIGMIAVAPCAKLVDYSHLVRGLVEPPSAFGNNSDDVFYPHAEFPG